MSEYKHSQTHTFTNGYVIDNDNGDWYVTKVFKLHVCSNNVTPCYYR